MTRLNELVSIRCQIIVNITCVLDRPHGHAFYEAVKNATNKLERMNLSTGE